MAANLESRSCFPLFMASDRREDAVLRAFSCEIMVEEKRPTIPIGSYGSQRPSLLGYNLYRQLRRDLSLRPRTYSSYFGSTTPSSQAIVKLFPYLSCLIDA